MDALVILSLLVALALLAARFGHDSRENLPSTEETFARQGLAWEQTPARNREVCPMSTQNTPPELKAVRPRLAPGATSPAFVAAPPAWHASRLGAVVLALVLPALALSGGIASSRAAVPTSSAAAISTPEPTVLRLPMSADQIAAGHGCPITGDMVWSPEGMGDGNPATIARALCGR